MLQESGNTDMGIPVSMIVVTSLTFLKGGGGGGGGGGHINPLHKILQCLVTDAYCFSLFFSSIFCKVICIFWNQVCLN